EGERGQGEREASGEGGRRNGGRPSRIEPPGRANRGEDEDPEPAARSSGRKRKRRGNVRPRRLVLGHYPPMNWPSSVIRSPSLRTESSSWVTPSTASLTITSMCSPSSE